MHNFYGCHDSYYASVQACVAHMELSSTWCIGVDRRVGDIPLFACEGHQKLGNTPCVLKMRHIGLPGLRRAHSSGWVEESENHMLAGIRPVLHRSRIPSQLSTLHQSTGMKSLQSVLKDVVLAVTRQG